VADEVEPADLLAQRIDLVVFPDLSKPFARLAASEGRPL